MLDILPKPYTLKALDPPIWTAERDGRRVEKMSETEREPAGRPRIGSGADRSSSPRIRPETHAHRPELFVAGGRGWVGGRERRISLSLIESLSIAGGRGLGQG
jgi:hypothetical protein